MCLVVGLMVKKKKKKKKKKKFVDVLQVSVGRSSVQLSLIKDIFISFHLQPYAGKSFASLRRFFGKYPKVRRHIYDVILGPVLKIE